MGRTRIVRGGQFHSDSWGRGFAGNYTNEIDKTVGLLQCGEHYILGFNNTVGLEQCGAHYITEFNNKVGLEQCSASYISEIHITIGLERWGHIKRWRRCYINEYASTVGLTAAWEKLFEGESMLRGRNHCR